MPLTKEITMDHRIPDKTKLPGIELLGAALQVHTTVVQKHIDTVNEVWSQVTSQEASVASWTTGFSKLLQTWTDNTKDLMAFYSGKLHAPAAIGCPELVFVLDKYAQASGAFQCVPVPVALHVGKITATPLLNAAGVALDTTASHLTWVCDAPGVLKVAISGLGMPSVPPAHKTGTYTALIYELTSTPPVKPLASVRLTFLA
jgi:hypothetical protein